MNENKNEGPKVEGVDPMMAEAVQRAYRTGKMIIANRDADGKVTMTESDLPRPAGPNEAARQAEFARALAVERLKAESKADAEAWNKRETLRMEPETEAPLKGWRLAVTWLLLISLGILVNGGLVCLFYWMAR